MSVSSSATVKSKIREFLKENAQALGTNLLVALLKFVTRQNRVLIELSIPMFSIGKKLNIFYFFPFITAIS
jgi:hypothetical protein